MKLYILFLIILSFPAFSYDYSQEEIQPQIKLLPEPVREVSVIVTKEGYYPKQITVFEGDKINFYVTSTIDEPQCMMISEHNVFLAAQKGKITEGETIFSRSGIYNYYCPSSKLGGKIVVMKRKSAQPVKAAPDKMDARKPAYWMPKEY